MQCPPVRGSAGAPASLGAWPGVVLLVAAMASAAHARADAAPQPVPSFAAPFAFTPLARPLVLNGGFCEYRSNHFHAGLDLGTGRRVGRPVVAPADGWIERVRASGAGYGRSIYLHADDGRLLVFAHLDAYAQPLSGYVAAAQESSGQYEQDLWPAPGQFRVSAGQRIGWSGQSGSGGPHLHVEVRRGDIAYNPLRGGFAIPDSSAPTLVDVTFEPLDDTSYVERSAAPVTVRLGARPPTVRVAGRVRAVVGARDGVWRGVDRMVPWAVAVEFDGVEVECRFDSVSWATDMAESDHVYDSGRVVGGRGMVMWAPGGFRPRVMRTNVPDGEDAGTLVVRPGDPPRTLTITARDLAGNVTRREVVLRPPPAGARGPDTTAAGGRALADTTRWFDLAALPGHWLRVTYRGAPAGSRGVTIGGRPASLRDGAWTAVVGTGGTRRGGPPELVLPVHGRDANGRPWGDGPAFIAIRAIGPGDRIREVDGTFEVVLPRDAMFEPAMLLQSAKSEWPARVAGGELAARSGVVEILPSSLRLRRPLRLEWGRGDPRAGTIGLYQDEGDGWGWVASPYDSALRRRVGETRHLGRFALFADTLAPRITLRAAPGRAPARPYSRWALEARVVERGSGVDRRASWFEVDGRRVPAEWDDEASVLRWRPTRAPAPGTHRVVVVVSDRAGNERRAAGRFTMK